MAALDSLIPSFEKEGEFLPVRRKSEEDEMPGLEAPVPCSEMPGLEPLVSEDADDEAEEAEETEEAEEADVSADFEPIVEEHDLEKNPFEVYQKFNTCIFTWVLCTGVITGYLVGRLFV